ncbi:unnamed protein product [Porites lobata]|uniref:Uncharacterized protein n=1 Tax=Porites lobata TaxID=104759 RepID=A0ABN8S354_9CNID|nr:unnamed protein product [Porites lobata]
MALKRNSGKCRKKKIERLGHHKKTENHVKTSSRNNWQVCCAYGAHIDKTDQAPVFIKRTSILQEVQFKVSDL